MQDCQTTKIANKKQTGIVEMKYRSLKLLYKTKKAGALIELH